MIGKKGKIYFYSVRYTDIYGKVRQKYHQDKRWKLKGDVEAAQKAFLASVSADTSNFTIDTLFGLYFDDLSKRAKQITTTNELSAYKNHIAPYFADKLVKSITPRQISLWQDHLVSQGYKNGTLKTIQMKFRSLLNYAIEHEIIDKSPFRSRTSLNKRERSDEMLYWTPDEYGAFIEAVDDEKMRTFYNILYWAGLRKGEAMALTINDIDFTNNTINVNKTLDYAHGVVTSPKTQGSYRSIQMTTGLSVMLKDYTDKILSIPRTDKTAKLFYLDHFISTTTIEHTKNTACKKAGVKQIRIHDIRHSHVSLLINMGFAPFEIGKRLGHSPAMVENTYSHLFVSTQKNMVDRLDEVARRIEESPKDVKFN